MHHTYKSPGNHNANRMGRTGTYLQAARAKKWPGTNGSGSARSTWEYCEKNAANPSNGVLPRTQVYHVTSVSNTLARCNRVFTTSWIFSKLASPMGFRAIKNISQPNAILFRKGDKAALNRRFTRFLLTALPILRPATTPMRGLFASPGEITNTRSGWA